jgi:hypothetical protein
MEWLDSLWAWVMSLIASLFALFGVSSVSEASRSVEAQARASQTHPPRMDSLGAFQASDVSESSKAAEVFEALAAQVPPMLVELPVADVPPNM